MLKWTDLRVLCECFLQQDDELNDVYYFSAYLKHIQEKYQRHKTYVKALQYSKVTSILGKFKRKYAHCKICKQKYQTWEEKQSDINIALKLLEDAFLNKYDKAFLLTADTDLVSTVKKIRQDYNKKVILLVPPRRFNFSNELRQNVDYSYEIKKSHLKKSVLPNEIKGLKCPYVKEKE